MTVFGHVAADYHHVVGDMICFFCHVCQERIEPVWELTRKGRDMGIELKDASKDRGEKWQIPASLYWESLNKEIWKPFCSPECSLKDHEIM